MIEKQAVTELLRELRFTADLPGEALDEIARIASVVEFPAGTPLFQEGAENRALYIIEHGRVGLDMHVPGRGRIRVLSVGSGDVLAWSALLGEGVMTVSATALEPTRAVTLPAKEVLELCARNHEIGYGLMRHLAVALAQRLVATRLQLLDLFSEPTGTDGFRS
ncbi:MAG TPA: Crp/Fnr family transcriptional regulator [Pirellulales bacterium]|nr:Crp/Fnr family transcriptional regulator [Pirellulales bacterium]